MGDEHVHQTRDRDDNVIFRDRAVTILRHHRDGKELNCRSFLGTLEKGMYNVQTMVYSKVIHAGIYSSSCIYFP